jgi:hypothetical protein
MAGVKDRSGRKLKPEWMTYRGARKGVKPPPDLPPSTYVPVRPDYLKGLAAEIWDDTAPKLAGLGILEDELSAALFPMCCTLLAECQEAYAAGKSFALGRLSIMMKYLDDFGIAGPKSLLKFPWLLTGARLTSGRHYGAVKPSFIEGTLAGEIWNELAPKVARDCLLLPIHEYHLAITCVLLAEQQQAYVEGKPLPKGHPRMLMKCLGDWGRAGPRSRAKFPWLAGR